MPDRGFRSFGEILRGHAIGQPNERAFVFLDRDGNIAAERTFAQLDEQARAIGGALSARGLTGRPVLLVFPSCLEFVDALFGCFYAGCIAVPAPYLVGKRAGQRITAIFSDCLPEAMLTRSRDADIGDRIRRESPDLVTLHVDALETTKLASGSMPRTVGPDDIALLQYTSGSISAPKGVVLSHGNLIANNEMTREAFGNDANTRGVSWLPLFHDMGLIGHILQPVYIGGPSVLMSPQTFLQRPFVWLKAISDWRANVSGGPNHAFSLCARMVLPEQARTLDLSSWSISYCGSEMIHAEVLDRFADMFAPSGFRRAALYPCYGLAEATSMVSSPKKGTGFRTGRKTGAAAELLGAGGRRIVGCGRPPREIKVLIVDPDSKTLVTDCMIGEIWVQGPNVGRGYWRRPEESEATFGARLQGDDAGYLRTGDLGFIEDGELFIVGRIKDTIIVRGINYGPEDIESTVAASHPAFLNFTGAAFGLIVDGEEQVVVVQEVGREVDGSIDWDAAARDASNSVTREQGLRLHELVIVRQGTIPRTSSGKIRRGRCREMYQASLLDRLNLPAALKSLAINMTARSS